MRAVLILSLISSTLALQLPFKVPFFQSSISPEDDEPARGTPKVAIIGAGAAGTSAAFWISKAQERFGVDVEVDVYEKTSHIGGSWYSFPEISKAVSDMTCQGALPYTLMQMIP